MSMARTRRGVAPRVGLEPTTLRLTAGCSTIELSGSGAWPHCSGTLLYHTLRPPSGLGLSTAVGRVDAHPLFPGRLPGPRLEAEPVADCGVAPGLAAQLRELDDEPAREEDQRRPEEHAHDHLVGIHGGELSHLLPALEGLAEGHLVGVLEVAADRQPAGDASDAHAERPQQLGEIDRGGLALHARVRGEDHLVHRLRLEPGEQLAHLDVLRPDPVQRRERAEQHVVAALELTRALEGEEIVRLLDHAETPGVSRGIPADAAGILLGDVPAARAMHDTGPELGQRHGELVDLVGGALEEEEREPLRGLRPDARQSLQRLDEARDGVGEVGHHIPRPGILSPPVSLPISACIISLDLRSASLQAARTRSSSIWLSSGLITSLSILIATISCMPFAVTVTMPPPAVASTVFFEASA